MKNQVIFLLLMLGTAFSVQSQLEFYSSEATDGYTLFGRGGSEHLVDNCGELINKWSNVSPVYHSKLLENGNLNYIDWITNSVIERDWDNNTVKAIEPIDETIDLQYEVIVLPNGNYLCLGRIPWTEEQFVAMGYDIDVIGLANKIDVVVELNAATGATEWMWNIGDHVIQDRSDTIGNYGVVKDNPQLLNMGAISTFDWANEESFMINGMDYNPALDQIVLSVRKMGEIVVIDHSTTMQEAAGHTGGNSGKGGDIIYRWGNPQNYGRGLAEDQQLFYQHNPNWIHHGEHAGKIIMYNNGLNRPGLSYFEDYSSVPIIDPPIDAQGNYMIDAEAPFAPATPTVEYGKETTNHDFFSRYTSAAKVLPNGNILISVGGETMVFEIKPTGELVWQYQLPDDPFLFRVEKYVSDYPAFEGRDLTPMGTIEDPPSTVPCDLLSSISSAAEENAYQVWLASGGGLLHILPSTESNYQYGIIDFSGKTIRVGEANGGQYIDLGQVGTGIYAVQIFDLKNNILQTSKVFVP